MFTLPEREENNGFDSAELEDRGVGGKQVPRCKVEQEQSIKSQTHREVVNNCCVKVALVWSVK